MAKQYFRQTQDVYWLKTPKNTIWILNDGSDYLQPEDNQLKINLGVNVNLIDEDDWIWKKIETKEI